MPQDRQKVVGLLNIQGTAIGAFPTLLAVVICPRGLDVAIVDCRKTTSINARLAVSHHLRSTTPFGGGGATSFYIAHPLAQLLNCTTSHSVDLSLSAFKNTCFLFDIDRDLSAPKICDACSEMVI